MAHETIRIAFEFEVEVTDPIALRAAALGESLNSGAPLTAYDLAVDAALTKVLLERVMADWALNERQGFRVRNPATFRGGFRGYSGGPESPEPEPRE